MKYLIWLILPLLFACTTETPVIMSPTYHPASIEAFGTLTDANDPVAMNAAPLATHIAVYRRRTTTLLRKNLITVDAAKRAQDCADTIRYLVVNARTLPQVNRARELFSECENLLGEQR